MNHDIAYTSDAVERYVFGDMSDEEVSAFEAHVFDCGDCSKELELTASFAENARVVLGTRPAEAQPKTAHKRAWMTWPLSWELVLPYAAAALFGGIAVYQSAVVVPEARRASEPRALTPSILRVVRGEPPVVKLDVGAATFLLVVDLATPDAFPRYGVEVRSASGKQAARFESIAPPSGTLFLQLPADRFPDGDYDMILEGRGAPGMKASEVIETYRFLVLR
jgi:hypothetical protein